MYTQAMQMTFCQPTVMGLFFFHVQDEPARSAWQSGEFYVDGTPKTSLPVVAAAAASVHRGVVAACPGLHLSPRVKLRKATSTRALTRISLTCSVDCTYRARFDSRTVLTGSATGGVPKILLLRGKPATGWHRLTLTATAVLNAGPPTTATLTFRA
jgi:hypothetical protein